MSTTKIRVSPTSMPACGLPPVASYPSEPGMRDQHPAALLLTGQALAEAGHHLGQAEGDRLSAAERVVERLPGAPVDPVVVDGDARALPRRSGRRPCCSTSVRVLSMAQGALKVTFGSLPYAPVDRDRVQVVRRLDRRLGRATGWRCAEGEADAGALGEALAVGSPSSPQPAAAAGPTRPAAANSGQTNAPENLHRSIEGTAAPYLALQRRTPADGARRRPGSASGPEGGAASRRSAAPPARRRRRTGPCRARCAGPGRSASGAPSRRCSRCDPPGRRG